MTSNSCETYSRQYAQFVSKEVVKAAAAHIFDDLRQTLGEYLKDPAAPDECREQAEKVMELLSDVECRYYNEFSIQDAFNEVMDL